MQAGEEMTKDFLYLLFSDKKKQKSPTAQKWLKIDHSG
jgi:hypothetical protein